ncbi:MAG: glucan 1,4-alpha-glucosidase [Cyanobacteria bacterium QH_9_48_43]|jgi:glucoamylase|nr:MAG: glucan 1,4-alpha-glucosidase [Cyanobacteria bacterium QH_3_48_40]PSO87751.1 MAG: glucan 1,4-alpha-glucosidase [Cyanobacteria bacterium QS_5_48_63]PSO90208.1 MAG: glucan 1,4-alpha-glucosidase [Cyanobacteria bacterium QH_9_48_43]PSO96364.1 MAG: glucan 1,4-alpha-glucosidase [Cyanobacteria bacterium QS_9_48_30]PSP11488.1 MAG: glucan 1,4-alpha-glucosidase [Cyanobacteria bacterium SW_11_48_12]PSP19734.1 MAG: glucan 1,4-alpha-glucosidase [Cyanobacteria bacterium SW_5_48_44]
MVKFRSQKKAFGAPGIVPRWSHANKDGVGTAYHTSSRVWFTLWNGVITEVYYPTVDQPQIRDLQYLVTDGQNFFHEEKRHLHSLVERLWPGAPGYRITNRDPQGRYAIIKDVISDPHLPCVLQHTRLRGGQSILSQLQLYTLCAPHLEVGGWGNNAYVIEVSGKKLLVACKGETWLVLGATIPFSRLSCGYVGSSDGYTDLAENFELDWEFDCALDGNLALTGQLNLERSYEFVLGLAFGDSIQAAVSKLFQSLNLSFPGKRQRYKQQWERSSDRLLPLGKAAGDEGNLAHSSFNLIMAHEDKTYQGALIASLSVPWGEARGDRDDMGYHRVWTRDLVNGATGLLAAGNSDTALRSLIYLATTQQEDGGFPQNFWISGEPHWTGIQLDEVAFPILLAWQLRQQDVPLYFDFYPMVARAAGFLIHHGPATEQERWEESGGYSPSTLASNIAALICAASFARQHGDEATAQFMEEYADFLECHIEDWTVTTAGTLVPEIERHYIRITPADVNNPHPNEYPNHSTLSLSFHLPDALEFPAKEIVDAGFLQLVRYGIRKPDDPIIVDSLKVVDEVLKVDTPFGPAWHRYNHDGFGQREDGGPFVGGGKGRAWPLLTGERGHYELSVGGDVKSLIQAMEGFASDTGLLPEQVWDEPDRPEEHMYLGQPTGSAMPLMWAHAEYIKLLRSSLDGKVFDLIPEVAHRYQSDRSACKSLEVWKFNRQVNAVKRGYTLRIQAAESFQLRWSQNNWQTVEDTTATATTLGIEYVDIPVAQEQQDPIQFTFFWIASENWEQCNYTVAIE